MRLFTIRLENYIKGKRSPHLGAMRNKEGLSRDRERSLSPHKNMEVKEAIQKVK
jgi:hypothetical protein